MQQLQQQFEVGHAGRSREDAFSPPQRHHQTGVVGEKQVAHPGAVEVLHAHRANVVLKQVHALHIAVAGEAALADRRHPDLADADHLGNGAPEDLHAVRERPLLGPERRLAGPDDLSGRHLLRKERSGGLPAALGTGDLRTLHRVDQVEGLRLRRDLVQMLLGRRHEHEHPLRRGHAGTQAVHLLAGQGIELLADDPRPVVGRHVGHIAREMLHIPPGQVGVRGEPVLFERGFLAPRHLGTCGLELLAAETVASDLLHVGQHPGQRLAHIVLLGQGRQHEGVPACGEAPENGHHAFVTGVGAFLRLGQPGARHFEKDLARQFVAHGAHRRTLLLRRIGLVEDQLHGHSLGFGIGHQSVAGLVALRNVVDLLPGGIFGLRDRRHHVADLPLHRVHIHVADDDHRLQIGTIPFMVEVDERLPPEAVDDLHVADHIAPGVFRPVVLDLGRLAGHARAGVVAAPPLLADHAPLRLDLPGFAGDVIGPVVQDQQQRVHQSLAHQRHVGNIVDRAVARGVGIDVVSEAHSIGRKVVENALSGKVLRSVEGHVFEEMGQAVLIVLLLQGAYVVGDEEIRPLPGIVVMPDVVGHPVVEPADPDLAVERHLLLRACGDLPRRRNGQQTEQGRTDQNRFFHRGFA